MPKSNTTVSFISIIHSQTFVFAIKQLLTIAHSGKTESIKKSGNQHGADIQETGLRLVSAE